MRYNIGILFLVLVCTAIISTGQQTGQREKSRCVIVPSGHTLPVIASQLDCPLQIEEVKSLACLDGRRGLSYQLRNRGTKSIRSVIIAERNTTGTGNTWSWGARNTNELVLPDQLVPPWSEDNQYEIVTLTDKLRGELKLDGPMKGVVVLMVVRVEFADGTIYNDEQIFKALEAYSEDLYLKLERLEYLQHQQK